MKPFTVIAWNVAVYALVLGATLSGWAPLERVFVFLAWTMLVLMGAAVVADTKPAKDERAKWVRVTNRIRFAFVLLWLVGCGWIVTALVWLLTAAFASSINKDAARKWDSAQKSTREAISKYDAEPFTGEDARACMYRGLIDGGHLTKNKGSSL